MMEHKRLHRNDKTGLYETTLKEAPKKKEIIHCVICDNKFQEENQLKIHVEEIHVQKPKPKRDPKKVARLITKAMRDQSKAIRKQSEKAQLKRRKAFELSLEKEGKMIREEAH